MKQLTIAALLLPLTIFGTAIPAWADWGDIFQKSRTELVGTATDRNRARLYIPKGSSKQPRPLIVLLHGYGFDPERNLRYLNLREPAIERNTLLLVPEGLRTDAGNVFWNATDFCCDTDHKNPDDAGYLQNLINEVKETYSVDANRIYLIGYSNGGFMANRLVAENKGLFAGVVNFAGGHFKDESKYESPSSIPFLQIHADDDATVTYGDDDRYAGGRETFDRYRKTNACPTDGVTINKVDLALNVHGSETIATTYLCPGRVETSLWLIEAATNAKAGHKPVLTESFAPRVLDWLLKQHRYPTY